MSAAEQDTDLYFGAGQRMFATDQGEYPLLDVRAIKLDTLEPGEQTSASDAEGNTPGG